jgi:1-phosphatidylinositol phosphodiesterase
LLEILGGDTPADLKSQRSLGFEEDTQPLSLEAPQPRVRGWVLMDYFCEPENAGVVPLLVECNFRGRLPGDEGWPMEKHLLNL